MYMSVEDQYFWEFVLVIPIVATFSVWCIKHYIDGKINEQYRLGYDQGWNKGWDECVDALKEMGKIKE